VRRREQAAGAQQVFDRELKRAQRNRAATASGGGGRGGQSYDYLREEVAARLADRLRDISRTFPRVLDVGAGHGSLLPHLLRDGEFGVETLVQVDSAEKMLWRDVGGEGSGAFAVPDGVDVHRLVRDEECLLPPPPLTPSDDDGDGVADTDGVYEEEAEALLQRGTFDCVLSSMALHWVNDLPGVMVQARKLLKPDGIFLAAMLGGDSLHELRSVLAVAEQEREGGLSPRVSPRVGVDVAGSLLNRAGFTLLTVDTDQLVVPYPDALTLMHGERNGRQLN
jgi:NADH dehydrogenase [ubiquinone] 1 alpha subcomplex assembly factor 5